MPSNLPFSATFNSSNVFAGQNVSVASQLIVTSGGTNTHATTVTLMSQTINGTITGVSSSGGFTVYSVSLAAYDLFPILAVQPGANHGAAESVVHRGLRGQQHADAEFRRDCAGECAALQRADLQRQRDAAHGVPAG